MKIKATLQGLLILLSLAKLKLAQDTENTSLENEFISNLGKPSKIPFASINDQAISDN